jgi:hypothetical protein
LFIQQFPEFPFDYFSILLLFSFRQTPGWKKKYKSCPKFVLSTYIVFSTNKKIAISGKKNFPEFPFD